MQFNLGMADELTKASGEKSSLNMSFFFGKFPYCLALPSTW